jgi:hypothetical protein
MVINVEEAASTLALESAFVGRGVGAGIGTRVGAGIGTCVGFGVGSGVGCAVGSGVGAGDGRRVLMIMEILEGTTEAEVESDNLAAKSEPVTTLDNRAANPEVVDTEVVDKLA